MMRRLLLLFFGSLICALGRGQDCPEPVVKNIQDCVLPVITEAERLGLGVQKVGVGGQQLVPNMGEKVFEELCGLIAKFDACLEEHGARRRCPNHITLKLIDSSYGYLCKDGRSAFLENADCLMKLDQELAIRSCHDRTMTRIKEANTQTQTFEQKTSEMCRALDSFTLCVQSPVKRRCGDVAWGVIVRVLQDTTRTLMPNCELSRDIDVPAHALANLVTASSPPTNQQRPGGQTHPPIRVSDTGGSAYQNEAPFVKAAPAGGARSTSAQSSLNSRGGPMHTVTSHILLLSLSCSWLLFRWAW